MDHISSLSVYETPTNFYIIGSDPSGSHFRTLKIDRIADKEFVANESDQDYSKADIGELLATVSSSSIVTPTEKWNRRRNCAGGNGLLQTVEKAYGLIGAIRFLEGYYLLVVSRARQICQKGFHAIYKVEDVSMIYLPFSCVPSQQDELKYAKLFQTVDFTTNFYFSYTYQLSRTLQENCLAERGQNWNRNMYRPGIKAEKKFIWNEFLLEPFRKNKVHKKWYLELVHGYIGHQLVELPCAKLDLILLARRSSEFAGTRFLKRGTNYAGAVANDVETEQIVWDITGPLSFRHGKFTAFVQRRGSVPLFWSQDSTHRGAPMVVGKPPIVIDRVEPHALTTAMHFRDLRRKYSHPIIVLNLVKRDEHKHNENLLHDIFLKTVRYLNQFRSCGHCIDYISFDVSRCNKTGRVLQRLEQLGLRTVLSTGWFQSFPELKSRCPATFLAQQKGRGDLIPTGAEEAIARYKTERSEDEQMLLQHGIARANCVDCLDRTNVVQFGIGKAALGWQLFSMGLLQSPWSLGLQTELCRLFEELFDEHGDTLAWQYAGSQLVHSIKTYKRTAVLQERSRDVLQTISRYYSNTFSDFEKQDGINLFLGIFRVRDGKPPIWSLGSDGEHYLHFPTTPKHNEFLQWSISVSSDNEDDENWLAEKEFKDWMLVKASESQDIRLDNNWVEIDSEDEKTDEEKQLDLFELAHRTFELTSLEQLVRQNQQMQTRRPVVLEALGQAQQSSSFIWMFKNEHSPSPPPPSMTTGSSARKASNASSIAASTGGTQVVLSSLAAGTASIVRQQQQDDKAGQRNRKKPSPKPLRLMGQEEEEEELDGEEDTEVDEERVQDNASTLLLTRLDEQQTLASSVANPHEAALAVAAVEEEMDRPEVDNDLLVIEDRNAPGEAEKDPLYQFQALLNGTLARRTVSTAAKEKLTLGTGLKSPNETYFGCGNNSSVLPLLAISDQDMALYSRYASAAAGVFERHNARRQKRPTVWRLPNPLKNIRRIMPAVTTPNTSPTIASPTTGRWTPMSGRKQQPQKGRRNSDQLATSPPPSAKASPLKRARPPAQSSPFRKDFSRLGPVFEFRPALFTVDSAFHTELGEVPEESLRLYRQAVDAAVEAKKKIALEQQRREEVAGDEHVEEENEMMPAEEKNNGEEILIINCDNATEKS